MWEKILLSIFILAALVTFLKLSSVTINGRKLISLKYRILIALIFPILLVTLLFFGSLFAILFIAFILIFVLLLIIIAFLLMFFGKTRIKYIRM